MERSGSGMGPFKNHAGVRMHVQASLEQGGQAGFLGWVVYLGLEGQGQATGSVLWEIQPWLGNEGQQGGGGSWPGCRSARACKCAYALASPGTWECIGALAHRLFPYDLLRASGKEKPSCCPAAGVMLFWGLVLKEQIR